MAIVLLSMLNLGATTSAQTGAAWPTFHGNISRSALTTSSGPVSSAISNQWQLPAAVVSSPAVDSSGVAYVGVEDSNVYALSPSSSTPKWSFQTGGKVISSPTLSADGSMLFVGSDDGKVHALNTSTGAKLWSAAVGGAVDGSPLLSPDGTTVFIATVSGEVWALKTSDGTPLWPMKHFIGLASSVTGSLAFSPDGSILYVAAADAYMYGIAGAETTSPSINTTFYLGAAASTSPAVDANGNVYVGTQSGNLLSFTPSSSTPRWTFSDAAHIAIMSTPALAGGQVIFGADDQNVYSIDAASGQQSWQAHTGGSVASSPAISGNGFIYLGSDDGTFYSLTTSGALAWAKTVGSAIDSSPAIGPNSSVWVGSQSGVVYRFGQAIQPTATSTFTPTSTSIVTATPTSTASPTPTNTATPTNTPNATATSTETPVVKAPTIRRFLLLRVVPKRTRSKNWPFKNGEISLRVHQQVTFAIYVFVPKLNRRVQLRFQWTVTHGRTVAGHHASVKQMATGRSKDYVGRWTYTPKEAGQYEFGAAAMLNDGVSSVTRKQSFRVRVSG